MIEAHEINAEIFANVRVIFIGTIEIGNRLEEFLAITLNLVGVYNIHKFTHYIDSLLFIVDNFGFSEKQVRINTNHCEYNLLEFCDMQNCIVENGIQIKLFTQLTTKDIVAPKLYNPLIKNANKA
jgi:hypothetical protein